ncbi:MAG: 50S ribosomal protein L32 [Candidatus Caldatribacteriota bacterium]|nr:50S ribosomal protein L32 [Candidatus Caldatribacteriota bacterium]
MPMPKRKTSKSKTNKRRTNCWNLDEKNLVECPRCHEMKLPHRTCPECGYYNGKKIILSKSEKEKKKEKK